MGVFQQKLAKLTLSGYLDAKLSRSAGSKVEAMYNPASIDLNYGAKYDEEELAGTSNTQVALKRLLPGRLKLELLFDNTLPGNTEPVDAQLTRLRELCGVLDARTGEIRYLKVEWGKFSWHGQKYYVGRMASLAIRCSLFHRDGSSARASATLELIEDSLHAPKQPSTFDTSKGSVVRIPDAASLALIASGLVLTGLDVAHVRNPVDYLTLARSNNLDSLDSLMSGKALKWPDEGGSAQ